MYVYIQGGPQKCPYFSLAITFTKLKKAPPHFSNRTLEYLSHNFLWDRLILRQNDHWPSYSQDLNPPDYFLRRYLKDRVCENNPQTREDNIRREIRWIPQERLNRVVDSFNVRVAPVLCVCVCVFVSVCVCVCVYSLPP